MKDLKKLLILALGGFVVFVIYFATLDSRFVLVEDLYDFPVPKKAKLVYETDNLKDYYDDTFDGVSMTFSYKLMLRKSGWKEAHVDIAPVYEKDGHYVLFGGGTMDYFDISDFTPYVEVDDEEKQ